MIQGSVCAHQKNPPHKSYSSSYTCNKGKITLSTQCTHKTYPTSGNNFPTLKDMIVSLACGLFCFAESITSSSSLNKVY
jgi:hypothetical protein